ncbi:MAG: Xaa-Pro peptidase family protein [Candidatus Micrarchaeota archaeon]
MQGHGKGKRGSSGNDRLKEFFAHTEVDALLLINSGSAHTPDANFFYYSGFSIAGSALLATRESKILYTSQINYSYANEVADCEVRILSNGLKDVLAETKTLSRVGANFNFLNVNTFKKLSRERKKLVDVGKEMELQRMIKDESELSLMKHADSITRKIFESIEVRAGRTEREIAEELSILALENGARNAFPPIVLAGSNSRFPHGEPSSSRKVRADEMVLIDYGARFENYCADMTRCFFLGACKEERAVYEKLKEISANIASKLCVGMRAEEVRAISAREVKRARLPKMIHSIGHGIGLEVHEAPSLRKSSKDILGEEAMLTLEPAFYGKNFGVRFENVYKLGEKEARLI